MQLQLEGPDLDELLARIRREHGPRGRIVSAEKVRTGGLGGFFATERYEVVVEVDAPERSSPAERPAASAPRLDDLLGAMADRVSSAEQALARRRPAPAQVPTESPSFRSLLDQLTHSADGGGSRPAPPRPPAVAEDALRSLVTALRHLPDPPAPPTEASAVLALVGDAAAALRAARDLATELRLPAEAVTVASRSTLPDRIPGRLRAGGPASAAQRRAEWARRGHLTIVVVDAPVSLRGVTWARDVLAALQPTATWALVEATRKPDDVRAWAAALGSVQALAVDDVDSTADPASMLAVGLPVARLDGRPATRSAWAGVLAPRVAVGDGQGARG